MKKKYAKITHVDGTTHLMPLGGSALNIGQPLNAPENIGSALRIANTGYCPDAKATQPVIVPPAQIKSVQLIEQ